MEFGLGYGFWFAFLMLLRHWVQGLGSGLVGNSFGYGTMSGVGIRLSRFARVMFRVRGWSLNLGLGMLSPRFAGS